MICLDKGPWNFQFLFDEIKSLASSMNVGFRHVYRLAIGMANSLAKLGVDRDVA